MPTAGQPDYARNFYDAALDIDPADAGAQKALADAGPRPPGNHGPRHA